MTGTMLTTLLRRLMNSTSRGRRLRRQHERTGRKTLDLRTKAQEIVTQSSRTRGQMFLRNVPDGGTFTVPTSYHAPIITECVNICLIQLGEAAKAFPAVWESICMWLEQRILAWLTTLSHRLLVVNNKACALEKEHAEKDKSAELIACTQTHTESLSLASFLPLPH